MGRTLALMRLWSCSTMLFRYWARTDLDGVVPAKVELVAHAHASQGRMRWLKAVQRDRSRLAVVLQRFAEERLGGCHIPSAAEMRFHGSAPLVHSAVQIHPLAANLNVSLVAAPRPAD